MRIYMDCCCLGRPFDDLTQDRIYLEAEAALSIISRCERNEWTLIASGALDYELSRITDESLLEKIQSIYSVAKERVKISPYAEQRAAVLQTQGLRPFDSLHVALAEKCNADIFLTTDTRLLKVAGRENFNIRVENPAIWLMEVTT